MKQWYEELFTDYSEQYEKEVFTQGTAGECDFFEKELNYDTALRILDVGCGTGRHSIELSRRGYDVTGVDLSESMLKKAKARASALKLSVRFEQHDARDLPFLEEFDMVLMICEGAFPLMETDEMNFRILQGNARALKTGGKLIFTTLNGLFPLFHSVRDFLARTTEPGNATYHDNSFDLLTFRDHNITEFTDDHGNTKTLDCNERYYVPPEITWLLKSAGFSKIEFFGAKLGAFSRQNTLTSEDFEMLVVAEK